LKTTGLPDEALAKSGGGGGSRISPAEVFQPIDTSGPPFNFSRKHQISNRSISKIASISSINIKIFYTKFTLIAPSKESTGKAVGFGGLANPKRGRPHGALPIKPHLFSLKLFDFLLLNVSPYYGLVFSDSTHEIPQGPKPAAPELVSNFRYMSEKPDRDAALDGANYITDRVLRGMESTRCT
jgi:hypothetical protein